MLRRADTRRRGFTLVEVIVTLVVLGLLAALAIPAMTGWIAKSKEKRVIVNCRACVDAAQSLAVLGRDGAGGAADPNPHEVTQQAGVPGTVTGIARMSPRSSQIKQLTYTENGVSVTYYADGPKYLMGGASAFADGAAAKAAIEGIYGVVHDSTVWNDYLGIRKSQIDSTTTTGTNYQKLKSQFDALQLGDAGVMTWQITNESSDKNKPRVIVYITDQSLDGYKVDDKVRVIRYNFATNNYTAGYLTVETETLDKQTYKVLRDWTEYKGVTQSSEDKLDPGKIVDIFNDMPVTPEA